MPYTVTIKRVLDGEQADTAFDGEWDEYNQFYWQEGSFACDCNRAAAFNIFHGAACGTGEYLIRVTLPDGSVAYDEIDVDATPDPGAEVPNPLTAMFMDTILKATVREGLESHSDEIEIGGHIDRP